MTNTLALIICTYRRPESLARLLEAVALQTRRPDTIVIVDASPDARTEAVARAFQQRLGAALRYERAPDDQRGLTRQRNYGVARAQGDLIAFLDDDTVPEPDYFQELLACFERHPEALGAGGYIVDEAAWHCHDGNAPGGLAIFRWGGWARREDYRWRLRRLLGLAPQLPPGWMPASGHGRSVAFLPPDGQDHQVEFVMGGAAVWRSEVVRRCGFSTYFEGYGLYEDLDFCIRAARAGSIYLCTRARLAHHHAPQGRPDHLRYGEMVVRNGWFVWRRRWPTPPMADRLRWWAITLLLLGCRLGDALRGPARLPAAAEAFGRARGIATLLLKPPENVYES